VGWGASVGVEPPPQLASTSINTNDKIHIDLERLGLIALLLLSVPV
jgi:hypothetical protein